LCVIAAETESLDGLVCCGAARTAEATIGRGGLATMDTG
jgi:hypothetical protein